MHRQDGAGPFIIKIRAELASWGDRSKNQNSKGLTEKQKTRSPNASKLVAHHPDLITMEGVRSER